MKLLELRTEKGWSQEHIARLMGVSRATIVNWEKGNTEPSMSEAVKLAGLFGTTVENLMK